MIGSIGKSCGLPFTELQYTGCSYKPSGPFYSSSSVAMNICGQSGPSLPSQTGLSRAAHKAPPSLATCPMASTESSIQSSSTTVFTLTPLAAAPAPLAMPTTLSCCLTLRLAYRPSSMLLMTFAPLWARLSTQPKQQLWCSPAFPRPVPPLPPSLGLAGRTQMLTPSYKNPTSHGVPQAQRVRPRCDL